MHSRTTHGGAIPADSMLRNVLQKPVNFPMKCQNAGCQRSFASLHAFIANTPEEYAKLTQEELDRIPPVDPTAGRREFYYYYPQFGLVAHKLVGLPLDPRDPTFGDYEHCRTSLTPAPVGDVTRVETTPVDQWDPPYENPLAATHELFAVRVDPSDERVVYESSIRAAINAAEAAESRLDWFETDAAYAEATNALNPERALGTRMFREQSTETMPVTNAYLKILEIMRMPGVVPVEAMRSGILKVFFPAEAPGSSINAVAYSLRRAAIVDGEATLKVYYNWYANSLAEGLKDDFGLIKRNPERWLQNLPGTSETGDKGDIVANYENIVSRAVDISGTTPEQDPTSYGVKAPESIESGYHMLICDGGKGKKRNADGTYDYSNESDYNVDVIAAECAMVETLVQGGTAIVKTYWLGSSQSERVTDIYGMLMQGFVDSFEDVYIVKPFFSRPANEEVYIVATGFQELSPLFEQARQASIGTDLVVPTSVAPQVAEAVNTMLRRQTARLDRNWLYRLRELPLKDGSPYVVEQANLRQTEPMVLEDGAFAADVVARMLAV